MIDKYKRAFSRYFLVALLGLIVDYGLLVISTELFKLNYLIGACIGFLGGLLINYYLSNKFVFKNAKIQSNTANILLFGVIGLVGLVLLNLLMWLQVEFIGINYLVAKTSATVFVYLWNFFARSKLYHETA